MHRLNCYNNKTYLNWFFTFGDYKNLEDVKSDVDKSYLTCYDMNEGRNNTEKLYDYNFKLYNSLLYYSVGDYYNFGDSEFNRKKSEGRILTGKDNAIYNNIIQSIQLIEPISYSINLFHGFEWFLTYPKFVKNQIITFNFCLSKTPSYHVAAFFAKQSNPFIQKYLYVKYPKNTKHLCPNFRKEFDDEYEYLAVNEQLQFIDTVYQFSLLPYI